MASSLESLRNKRQKLQEKADDLMGEVAEIQERIAAIDKEIFEATDGRILRGALLALKEIKEGKANDPDMPSFQKVLNVYIEKFELEQGVNRKRGRPRKVDEDAIRAAGAAYVQQIPIKTPAKQPPKAKRGAGAAASA